MGPFPHDAPPATISDANPMGTDGMEFVEYAHPQPDKLNALFETMGFAPVARHRSKNVTLWRQGLVNFVVNAEPDSFAQKFAAQHGDGQLLRSVRHLAAVAPCKRPSGGLEGGCAKRSGYTPVPNRCRRGAAVRLTASA